MLSVLTRLELVQGTDSSLRSRAQHARKATGAAGRAHPACRPARLLNRCNIKTCHRAGAARLRDDAPGGSRGRSTIGGVWRGDHHIYSGVPNHARCCTRRRKTSNEDLSCVRISTSRPMGPSDCLRNDVRRSCGSHTRLLAAVDGVPGDIKVRAIPAVRPRGSICGRLDRGVRRATTLRVDQWCVERLAC